jgi:hypothetical protein
MTRSSVLDPTATVRDLAYDAAVLGWSAVAFGVLVAGVTVTASLLVFVVGAVVWLGFAYAARLTTAVDRRLAGWRRGAPVPAVYRPPAAPGFAGRLRAVTGDDQTWRDIGWLALTSVAGFALGLAALTVVAADLAYVSLPVWSWAVSEPAAVHGLTNLGVLVVDTPWEAIGVAVAGIALLPLALLVARGAAAAHAGLAARVLSPRGGVPSPPS